MTPEQYAKAKDIFLLVCDLPASERAGRLAELAGGDDTVREQAERMLGNDAGTDMGDSEFGGQQLREGLEAILRTAGDGGADGGERAMPELIGPYRVVRRAGSGGMGDVYEAEQESPRRRVAIKLMRSGLQSEALVRRFRREIEFLGRLSHPGVAQVFEAGVTSIGGARVPYCVMEFVDGVPLTAYAAARGLDVEAKLRLFAAICDVVQYAHQQGVIHRDLKPANILIQERGTVGGGEKRLTGTGAAWGVAVGVGDALPRILDFGIARAVDAENAGGGAGGGVTLATEAGQIIGTVAYMSPEQIAGRGGEVDTRTDVYALGVILFELLTGKLPHRTDGMALLEAARVKQEEPSRLSTVDRSLRGDLETIASKALEVEKGRRYGSASELGMDVRRYLASEVIAARPATVLYQLRKFAGRNRRLVVLGAVAVLALVGGLVATVVQGRIAVRERDVAVRKTEVAEAVSNVLLEALTVATPKGALGKEPRLIDAIERIERQALDEKAVLAPEVRAVVLNVIGIIHRERGDLERAEKVFGMALEIRRKVLAGDDPNLADSLNNMGLLRRKQERFAEAAAFMAEAVEVQRRSSFTDGERLARNIYNLGSAYISSGELEKAGPLLDEAGGMYERMCGAESQFMAINLEARARLALAGGRAEEALGYAERAVAMFRKTAGPVHPSIATSLRQQGLAALGKGDRAAAVKLLAEAEAMAVKVFPGEPPHATLRAIREDLKRAEGGG